MTSSRSDHGNLPANQIVRQRRQTIDLIVGPAVFDRHVDHTFRLSTSAVSMSLAGSRFSSESAPRPLYGAFFVKEFARAAHLFPSSVS